MGQSSSSPGKVLTVNDFIHAIVTSDEKVTSFNFSFEGDSVRYFPKNQNGKFVIVKEFDEISVASAFSKMYNGLQIYDVNKVLKSVKIIGDHSLMAHAQVVGLVNSINDVIKPSYEFTVKYYAIIQASFFTSALFGICLHSEGKTDYAGPNTVEKVTAADIKELADRAADDFKRDGKFIAKLSDRVTALWVDKIKVKVHSTPEFEQKVFDIVFKVLASVGNNEPSSHMFDNKNVMSGDFIKEYLRFKGTSGVPEGLAHSNKPDATSYS